MESFKICVYAICKNEESFVDRWMDSMSEADVVVVTDTGSADATVEKLRGRGAVVYIDRIEPWRFDTARNVSLDHLPEDVDICVCTDLDEVFEPGWREKLEAAWRENRASLAGKQVERRGRYLYNWSLKADGTPDVQFNYFKVHGRHGFRWVCPVHEYIVYNGALPLETIYIHGMVLNHYPDSSKSRGSYLPLLELAVEEDPEGDRMRYYLGREYMYKAQWQNCIDTLTAYLELKTATWNEERGAAMRWIAKSCHMLGRISEARAWYYRAIAEAGHMRDPYVEFAKMCYEISDWPMTFFLAKEALKIKEKSPTYVNMGYSWNYTPDDLCAIAAYRLGMMEGALEHAKRALSYSPSDERLKNNLKMIEIKLPREPDAPAENEAPPEDGVASPKLIHTLLFLLRENALQEDLQRMEKCLGSLEKSGYLQVVVFNQGFWSNEQVSEFLSKFRLSCTVIGAGKNTGTTVGRQSCFFHIWEHSPETAYISELHPDMIFTRNWEAPLIAYLEAHDEPMISCGIVDKEGNMGFLNATAPPLPGDAEEIDAYLAGLTRDAVTHGFTNPCIHKADILRKAGGYDANFLTGMHAFEDDSMLLGYYYYYGTRMNWKPKVCYRSVVYHECAGQRAEESDDIMVNYRGLVRQYGAMGLRHLAELHRHVGHIRYFLQEFFKLREQNES